MPYFVDVLRVVPPLREQPAPIQARLAALGLHYPHQGADAETQESLERRMGELARAVPECRVSVAFRGNHDWVELGIARLAGSGFEVAELRLSLDPDRAVPLEAEPAPEQPIELDVEADRVVDAIEAIEPEDYEGQRLTLPFAFASVQRARLALSTIAAHVVEPVVRVLIEVDGAFYRAALERSAGVRLEPLFPFHADPDVRRLAQSTWCAELVTAAWEPCQRAERAAPAAQALKPLTTGSKKRRAAAAAELVFPKPQPGAFEAIAAALKGSENREDCRELRLELFDLLARSAPSHDALAKVLVGLLPQEDEHVRVAIYGHLAKLPVLAARRAVVHGFKAEPADVRKPVGEVLWRQLETVEVLVREELVPNWEQDTKWCKRIVRLLAAEYLPVSRAWLEGAPPALVEFVAGQTKLVD